MSASDALSPGDTLATDERLRELLKRARERGAPAALLPAPPDGAPPPPRSWADTDDDEEGP